MRPGPCQILQAERLSRSPFTVDHSRCLVIQTAFLGDVVLTTPLLSVLAARHGPVDVVTTPAAAGLLEGHPAVRRCFATTSGAPTGVGADSGDWGVSSAGGRIPGCTFRTGLLRSAALALWSGAPERVGFADAPGAISYTSRVPRPATGHEVERLLALAQAVPEEQAQVSLPLTDEDLARADAWLIKRAWEPGSRRWLRDRSGEPSAGHIFRSSPPDSTG